MATTMIALTKLAVIMKPRIAASPAPGSKVIPATSRAPNERIPPDQSNHKSEGRRRVEGRETSHAPCVHIRSHLQQEGYCVDLPACGRSLKRLEELQKDRTKDTGRWGQRIQDSIQNVRQAYVFFNNHA